MKQELRLEESRKDLGRVEWSMKALTLATGGCWEGETRGSEHRPVMNRAACPWGDGFGARGRYISEGEGYDKPGKLVV